ncbi:PilW family protein [Lysobacter silvisoli]|uniref:Pilus assembly protein PilW n=1 Tax=Lysobacter silvisoli TaxID=2293254 RepID=A0A371K5R7_9GAMM|nr:PilW family protein [Lysobacter silvisoli]RDZ29214.1 pilus assembly protein PilW [Lysobacter silvisoli]
MTRLPTPTYRSQQGLSLVELMVALAIGMLLMLGLVQVMSASRSAYRLAEGIGRAQENARFAMDSLERDLRMAGHLGCINDTALMQSAIPAEEGLNLLFLTQADRIASNFSAAPYLLRFDVGMQGFEAVNTAPGDAVNLATGAPVVGNVNQWSPSLPADLGALQPVAGSDIVVLRYFAPVSSGMTGFAPGDPTSTITPTVPAVTTGGSGLFGLANCRSASVFAGTVNGAGVVTVGSSSDPLNKSNFMGDREPYDTGKATLYRAEVIVYFVGVGAGTGNTGVAGPSLYRVRYVRGAGGGLQAEREELVEGVESLQLLYGQDRVVAANAPPSGYVTTSWTANQVGGGVVNPAGNNANLWRRIGTVQVGLVMRSSEGAVSAQMDPATQRMSVLGTQVTPQDDGFYRSVYETTVAQRNRLFEN